MERLYCNTCRRFVTQVDIEQAANNNPAHKKHSLIWIDVPDSCKLDNAELNQVLSAGSSQESAKEK